MTTLNKSGTPRLWATGFIKIVWLAGKRSHTRPTTLVHCFFALAQFPRAQHVSVIKVAVIFGATPRDAHEANRIFQNPHTRT